MAQLGLEKTQYHRAHARALAAVVSLLAQRWASAPAPTGEGSEAAEPPAALPARPPR